MSDEIKEGDIVYAKEIQQFGGDLRRPMRIFMVKGDTFGAILLRGDFGEPGVNQKMFHKHHTNWTRHP